jgi:hypothetical protein
MPAPLALLLATCSLTAGFAPMSGRLCRPRGRRAAAWESGAPVGQGARRGKARQQNERAADQRPMPADRPVAANLEVGPAQLAYPQPSSRRPPGQPPCYTRTHVRKELCGSAVLVPRVQQGPLCQRAVQRALPAAAVQEIVATTAHQTPSKESMRFHGLRQDCRQQETLPRPCHATEEGAVATPAASSIQHERALPIRGLSEAAFGGRVLCWTRQAVLRRSIDQASLATKAGLRLSRVPESALCARLLPGSSPAIAGATPARSFAAKAWVAIG